MTYDEIEDAVLALLADLETEAGVRKIASYGGEFSPDSFGLATPILPAVLVFIASGKVVADIGRAEREELEFIVYHAYRNLRGESEARSGVYALIEAVRGKLNRAKISGVGELRRVEWRVEGYSKELGLCVASARYRIKLVRNL